MGSVNPCNDSGGHNNDCDGDDSYSDHTGSGD